MLQNIKKKFMLDKFPGKMRDAGLRQRRHSLSLSQTSLESQYAMRVAQSQRSRMEFFSSDDKNSAPTSSVGSSSKRSAANAKYKLVGLNYEWEEANGLPMERLDNIVGREIYGVSFTTILPVEMVNVIDAQQGFKRGFYPQGNRDRSFTRVIEGDGRRTRGSYITFDLRGAKPGTLVSVYFSPTELAFCWQAGPLDPNFDMPQPEVEGLGPDDILALTQFDIDQESLGNILLMAADPTATVVLAIFYMVPHCIMLILIIWATHSAPKQMSVSLYQHDTILEWVCVLAIYFVILMKRSFDLEARTKEIFDVFALAKKLHHSNASHARGLRIGALFSFINLMQTPIAFVLSIFVAIYLSDNVFLNVLLNVVALDFVTEVDETMVSAFIKWRYSEHASISFSILDITYADNVDELIDLWHVSSSCKDRVLENLSRSSISNDVRWQLLTSVKMGLGLLGVTEESGDECVQSFVMHLGILDWDRIPDSQLLQQGGLYLSGTSNATWEYSISRRQRALLFQRFPELTVDFHWGGTMNLDQTELSVHHAPYILQIMGANANVSSFSCNGSNIGDLGIETLCEGLAENKKLKYLAFCGCELTDLSAIAIATFLRKNDSLETLFLIRNKGISDRGALALASALTKGDDRNKTLQSILMGLNNVSIECQEKCSAAAKGRMFFFPDEHHFCSTK